MKVDNKILTDTLREAFHQPVKRQLTVRLDADVVAWLQRKGKGYQTKMNALLREAMVREKTNGL
jgi:uncharacterized protein (DUF4415 family)